jgi:hypothetical protein
MAVHTRIFFVPTGMFLFFGVASMLRRDWVGTAIFLPMFVLSVLTLAFRYRSGIRTWTLSATAVSVATGIRPTKTGLVTKAVATEPKQRSTFRGEDFQVERSSSMNRTFAGSFSMTSCFTRSGTM